MDFIIFSRCYSRIGARDTRQTHREQPWSVKIKRLYTSTHTARRSSQSRPEVMVSSRRPSPRRIYSMPSTWEYQACYYCQNKSSMSVWLCLLYCCGCGATHTWSSTPRHHRATLSGTRLPTFCQCCWLSFPLSQIRNPLKHSSLQVALRVHV